MLIYKSGMLEAICIYFNLSTKSLVGKWNGLLVMLLFLFGCKAGSKLSNDNLATQYFPQKEVFSPQSIVFSSNEDSTFILFSSDRKDLLFMNSANVFSCKLKVNYSIFETYKSAVPSDTGSYIFEFNAEPAQKTIQGSILLPAVVKRGAIVRLIFRDIHRGSESIRSVVVKPASKFSSQNILLKNELGNIYYSNSVPSSSVISIDNYFPGMKNLWVRCYFRDFPLATLPFRIIEDEKFRMESDSLFLLYESDWDSIYLNRQGIYYLQPDTNLLSGFTIFSFDSDFPRVTKAEHLIEATRYLTTRKEYLHLMKAQDKKAELDNFWLDVGGSPDRARMLIREYYNRVQDANNSFTSYMEGWKTDRGMIYLIFGQPISIYRDDETEQWTYSGLNGFPDVLFIFRKMNNPFTEKDYALIRQPVYENIWYLAVDQWRMGRIVNEN